MHTKDIVFIALFASIIAALGTIPPITLPLNPVPISAQSLGVMLCGAILGAKRGSLACVLFLILLAVGFPVMAGGRGGVGILLGPSGGFILAWPVAAYVIGYLFEKNWIRINIFTGFLSIVVGGIIVLYTFGILWLTTVAGLELSKAVYGSLIFIPGDLVKAVMATIASVTVKRSFPLISPKIA